MSGRINVDHFVAEMDHLHFDNTQELVLNDNEIREIEQKRFSYQKSPKKTIQQTISEFQEVCDDYEETLRNQTRPIVSYKLFVIPLDTGTHYENIKRVTNLPEIYAYLQKLNVHPEIASVIPLSKS